MVRNMIFSRNEDCSDARMPQVPVPTYRVQYEPSRCSWTLTGPVGAKGFLRYVTGRDAVSYARWDARNTGGKVEVLDQKGRLFREISVEPDDSVDAGFVLPSI
jgi:hypothetical protein